MTPSRSTSPGRASRTGGVPAVAASRDAYIASQPPGVRARLKAIRSIVRAAAPAAVEIFSYRIPGFRLDDQPLVWYAAFREHISLYPMTAAIRRKYAADLEGYQMSTGTVRLPLDRPFPAALVGRFVRARIAEIRAKPRVARPTRKASMPPRRSAR